MVNESAEFQRDFDVEALNTSMAVGRYLVRNGLSGSRPIGEVLAKVPPLRDVIEFLSCDDTPKLAVTNERTKHALLGPVLGQGSLWITYAPELGPDQLASLVDSTQLVVGNCHWPSLWERHVETDFGVPGSVFSVLGPAPIAAPLLVIGYFGRTHCGFHVVPLDDMALTDYQVNCSVSGRNHRPLRMFSEAVLEASVKSEGDLRPPNALIDGAKMLTPFWQHGASDPAA